MYCKNCAYHYIGKGWYCWSGNKDLGYCNNGKPTEDRICYKSKSRQIGSFKEIKKLIGEGKQGE